MGTHFYIVGTWLEVESRMRLEPNIFLFKCQRTIQIATDIFNGYGVYIFIINKIKFLNYADVEMSIRADRNSVLNISNEELPTLMNVFIPIEQVNSRLDYVV